MSRTLKYGTKPSVDPKLVDRIDRHVVRRHTPAGFDRCMELAALDYAKHVAAYVTRQAMGPAQVARLRPAYVPFAAHAKGFGKR